MANLDFSPSVFDSDKPEPPTPTSSYWRRGLVILVLVLASVGMIAYILYMRSATHSQPDLVGIDNPLAPMRDIPATAALAPMRNDPAMGVSRTSEQENCTGDEIICAVATASKPADFLRKLIAAIPTASAKQYRVRLSVTAIEEPAGDNTADSSTP